MIGDACRNHREFQRILDHHRAEVVLSPPSYIPKNVIKVDVHRDPVMIRLVPLRSTQLDQPTTKRLLSAVNEAKAMKGIIKLVVCSADFFVGDVKVTQFVSLAI